MSDLDRHARAGIAAINEQRYDDAIASFREALALAPDRPDMNSALGMAHLHRGDVGSAVPYLEKAKALSEAYPDGEHAEMKIHFFTSLATAYHLLDRVAEARSVLEETIRRFPDASSARLQLAQLLLESCDPAGGVQVYREVAEDPALDDEQRAAARAVADAVEGFLVSEEAPSVFLEAHQASYRQYFDEIAASQPTWYAEAARMAQGPDGSPRPVLPEGARPYAMIRVDLVNPETNEVASVYSEQDPMVVQVEGLEPLAQLPVLLPWDGHGFDVFVCTRCPWHWLAITVQLEDAEAADALDEVIGAWYLAGYNGDFGSPEAGRFHYITDPEPVGRGGVAYTVDLGRAGFAAIPDLLDRLRGFHDRHPIRRVLLGGGRLPD